MALYIDHDIVSGHQQEFVFRIKGKHANTNFITHLFQFPSADILVRIHMDKGPQINNHRIALVDAFRDSPCRNAVHYIGGDIAQSSVWNDGGCFVQRT